MVTPILSEFFPLTLVSPSTLSHNIFCSKLKQVNNNPYISPWLIRFLDQREQRIVADGYRTEYVSVNRGVLKVQS